MGEENKKTSILIVDDSDDFREIMKTKLQNAGFEISTAVNGQEGLQKMKEVKPDLVLMDMEMPVMNGAEAVSHMQEDPAIQNTKVIFLTNYGAGEKSGEWLDDKFAREAGAVDYIRKTDSLDHILEAVRHYTNNK